MTGAERTRAYRRRQQEDLDLEVPAMLTAVALREKLNRALLELEKMHSGRAKIGAAWTDIEDDLLEGAQYAAQLVWREVGCRYGFKSTKRKPSR